MTRIVCVPRSLTSEQAELANRRSLEINPANAVGTTTVERTPIGRRGGPRRLTLLVGSRWPESGVKLTVQFLDSPTKELRNRILLHMNAWNKTANIQFVETSSIGMVRIARFDAPPAMAGYWSYVGTQILGIAADQPTMNLEGFTMRTPEREFLRVVRHEAGHTLGFEHEHMRTELVTKIDRKKAFEYFDRTQGWSKKETIEQVLTPLAKKSILGTNEADPLSIMCYEIPGEITKDGKPIIGGSDITPKDFQFAEKVYPKRSAQPAPLAMSPESSPIKLHPVQASEADTLQLLILDEFSPKTGDLSDSALKNPTALPRFVRVFASYGGARVQSAMRLRATRDEEPTSFGKIIRMHERIKNYTNRQEGSLPINDEMVKFGSQLFETLFQGDVRRLYDEARARQANRKLDIVMTSMISWIAEKPWEFAYDTSRNSFLATEDVHFVRNVVTAIPADSTIPQNEPLRILIASAQPVGAGRLSIEQEVEVIRRGFLPLVDAGLVQVEVLARATPVSIQRFLATGHFHVVHFIGHGMFDESKEEGALLFEDETGASFPIGERSIREIFGKRGVSLIFLNACQSGSGGRHNFNRGIAQALVSHGIPAVVANQYSVLDSSATSFARHFYWSLAHGMSIGQAACEARIGVNCSLYGELIDWAVPVVFARDPNMTLCLKPETVHLESTAVRGASRRAIQRRAIRVAVWDMDNVFPALEQTLERMNDAQETFGFEVVSLSVPIDAWDLESDSKTADKTPYLSAERLAGRLEYMTKSLRVNVLTCITRHWLRDKNWLNLYGWWPGKDWQNPYDKPSKPSKQIKREPPPVVIFSCAGFDELSVAGPDTDRAIANVMVASLTGLLADVDAHDRGAKDCPLSFNERRELRYLTGPQKFDSRCRDQLKKRIPQELPALESLLKTFQK